MDSAPLSLRFASGTLELRGVGQHEPPIAGAAWDERSACWRLPASAYAMLVRHFHALGTSVQDDARAYAMLDDLAAELPEPRPYQQEALQAWCGAQQRGVVVLPTGAGKTLVAVMAIERCRRSTVVIAPTLDLVRQWLEALRRAFGTEVGVVGGGEYRIAPLTVMTYDSAYLHMERLGGRFGLLIADECHHLPSEAYALAARSSLAPYRLGLTATPERADGRDALLEELLGPTVCRRDIVDLSGDYLSAYETVRVTVRLTADEAEAYRRARELYLGFVRQQGIALGSARGWAEFVWRCSQGQQGREAMAAYQKQRQLAFGAQAKQQKLGELLHRHRADRSIVFTQDNATAYAISARFLLPVITHQSKLVERSDVLAGLRQGAYRAVVTSKVLNEGVDVPEANVAVVVSGSASVREHVQRLGRILRKQQDKSAVLYEIVTAHTAEMQVSERRREHSAYGASGHAEAARATLQ